MNNEEEIEEIIPEVVAEEVEVKIERQAETLEAKKSRLEGQLARVNKDLGVVPERKAKSNDELDYGAKAFLVANGIKGEEMKLVEDAMKNTGGTLEQVLENKYFQSQLQEARDLAGTILATPKGKGGHSVPTDSVEYWMAKPMEDVPQEMRIKVVKARLAKEQSGGKFYNS